MELDLSRTIVAVSSPIAAGVRAIVRLSGEQTLRLLDVVLQDSQALDAARCQAASHHRNRLDLNWSGRWLDLSVYLWTTQRSFTGEPCAELHFVGSPVLVEQVVRRLTDAGAFPAERGEFALRSFLAGKIDLVQAEAILGVIESRHEDQLQWALDQLAGNISGPVRALRDEVVELLAHLEAGLDFVEEDIQFITADELNAQIDDLLTRVAQIAGQLASRGGSHHQPQFILVGPPNSGKSSLFNALLKQDRAIVSNTAGTTRDIVVAELKLDNLTIQLLDSAGVETIAGSSARAMAQSILQERVSKCDVVLLCQDMSLATNDNDWQDSISNWLLPEQTLVRLGTRADLATAVQLDQTDNQHLVSINWPQSIEELKRFLQLLAQSRQDSQFTQATHHTAIRCSDALHRAAHSLTRAKELSETCAGEELVANELHAVLQDLSSIIGEVHNDDILGEIFSRFCIGK